MIAGICLCVMLMALLLRGGKGPARIEHDDLMRLRRLAEKLHREDVHPFE